MSDDCLFCKIIVGDIPGDMVLETERVVAFRDIAPKAPVHVLVVPRAHVKDVAAAAREIPEDLAEMAQVAQQVADAECGGQYRWIFNTGSRAGQSVFHVHGHVIGGGELEWNPA
ncbi:HIT domain-containing protein [Demequina sp. SO4-18]|uniref:HIT domain-containing protein n=1 Tax=Demequina sp. SO4-18 TaxID=3401026 RepID=UPI003B5A028F